MIESYLIAVIHKAGELVELQIEQFLKYIKSNEGVICLSKSDTLSSE